MDNWLDKVIRRFRLVVDVLIHGGSPTLTRKAIPQISLSEIEDIRLFFPLEKFFIFGHARSGTTLLTRLIRLHTDVHCNYQGHFFTRHPTIEGLVDNPDIEAWFTRRSNRWNQGKDLSPIVLRAVVDFIMEREARPLAVKIVGDKSPNSLLNGEAVRNLHRVYPDGKLIFIVRDGRDAVVSHRFQTFIDAVHHLTRQDIAIRSAFEHDPTPYLEGEQSIFTEEGIRNAASGWVDNIRETDQYARQLFGGQYLPVRYEDLLSNPWKVMRDTWTFLDVTIDDPKLMDRINAELASNPDKTWQQKKAGDLINPLKKGKTGTWRRLFTERDKSVFKEIKEGVGPLMRLFPSCCGRT